MILKVVFFQKCYGSKHSFHANHVLIISISISICNCDGSFLSFNMLSENAKCLLTEDFSLGMFEMGCFLIASVVVLSSVS